MLTKIIYFFDLSVLNLRYYFVRTLMLKEEVNTKSINLYIVFKLYDQRRGEQSLIFLSIQVGFPMYKL